MFDFLFGEGQYAIKLVFGLVVVIGLLAAFFWALRRFGGDRLGNAAARGNRASTRERTRSTASRGPVSAPMA